VHSRRQWNLWIYALFIRYLIVAGCRTSITWKYVIQSLCYNVWAVFKSKKLFKVVGPSTYLGTDPTLFPGPTVIAFVVICNLSTDLYYIQCQRVTAKFRVVMPIETRAPIHIHTYIKNIYIAPKSWNESDALFCTSFVHWIFKGTCVFISASRLVHYHCVNTKLSTQVLHPSFDGTICLAIHAFLYAIVLTIVCQKQV